MKIIFILTFVFASVAGFSQTKTDKPATLPVWTETDRKYLLENLIRSRDEIIQETKGLTKDQWDFKESPDRWSVNQIVEHIAIWELLFMREVTKALGNNPDSTFAYTAPDSVFMDQDPQGERKNNAMEYTKPFSYAVPLGNNDGKNNVTWLTTMRNESIDYLTKETKNIRLQYDYCSGANVHQYYMMIFNHTYRHLRQIKKVKAHQKYPKS